MLLICYDEKGEVCIRKNNNKASQVKDTAKERSSFLTCQCRPRTGIGLLGLILRKFSRLYFVEICASLLVIDL